MNFGKTKFLQSAEEIGAATAMSLTFNKCKTIIGQEKNREVNVRRLERRKKKLQPIDDTKVHKF